MWSLYQKTNNDESGTGIFGFSGKYLEPLKFTNGKTQEDVVKETLQSIQEGHKIIFIKGVCGTGKSAIALNIAKNFKKSSIVVPIKSLQEQYERDYTLKKFIKKDNGNPLKIAVIKGRNNFPCRYGGDNADDPSIPCTIEIRDKNNDMLLKYIDENPHVNKSDFSDSSDILRMNVAPACPFWAPIMPAEVSPKGLGEYKKIKYLAVSGNEYALFQRKKGCPYYDQYIAYSEADVLIFNSAKYLLETQIGRKPKTDIEIIDECDEFLDNFSSERRININRLHTALTSLTIIDKENKLVIKDLLFLLNELIFNPPKIEIEKVEKSPFVRLIDLILKNPNLAEDEEQNYFNSVVEIARTYENILDQTYISTEIVAKEENQQGLFGKNYSGQDTLWVTMVSINLADKLKELIDINNVLVLMSGTLHSEEVLKDIFGLDKFKIIEAETKNPGRVHKIRTGLERNCSFANFSNGTLDRKMYLKILDACMANAKPPTLVHVSAFKDIPSEKENAEFKFDNLITQERLASLQSYGNKAVEDFYNKEVSVLFSTKCARGVDFPGDKCHSIVITRYPYPNIQGLFWKILKKEQPEKFKEFYLDKARRDLIQKVARGVRFKGDSVELLSPDLRVLLENFD